jgi:hypothetical protein
MSSSLTNAEAYFAPTNHIKAATWAAFEAEIKQAAIVQAKRVLSRLARVVDIEVELDSPETGTSAEYAIYEQALWMLSNVPMANADNSFAVVEAADPETPSNARKAQTVEISPEAVRWLCPTGTISLSRG